MNSKIRCLRNKILNMNMEGMIISNPTNIYYLLGTNAEGVLLLTRKENIFITDGRYIEDVQSTLTIDDEIVVMDIATLTEDDFENFFMFCENVGFEEFYLTYARYKEYMRKYRINSFEETDKIIEKLRIIKDDEELKLIKKACYITDCCYEHLKEFIKIGMTEKEVANEIEKFFKENDAELAFDTIIATGKNSSKPHAIPTDKVIEDGDVILIDMGCKYKGYCSDMSRTIFAGHIPTEVRNIYDLVLKNQLQVEKEMMEGTNLRTIAKMVISDFKLNGQNLIHSVGHGVGLDIHEMPVISPKVDFLLKENMVITNEPGIYYNNRFGVRIEDTVLITKNGCINLTKSGKDYTIVDQK